MKKNNKKGFTLVELVIVVAVMAILVAIAIPTVGSVTTKAQNAVNDSNANTIESMIKLEAANLQVGADGKVTVDKATIEKALSNAALGIETGTFYYNATTGSVTTTEPGTKPYFSIVFTNGTAVATEVK